MRELSLEEELIQSLDRYGTKLERRSYGIDVRSGRTQAVVSTPRKGLKNFRFDLNWVEENYYLVILLVNVRTRNAAQEWRDLLEFFKAARYVAIGIPEWNPNEPIEAVRREWRKYRDLTRDLIETPIFSWERKLITANKYRHCRDLVERATRDMVERVEREELYDPLDALWIALVWSRVKGIKYLRCANPDCERYVPISWRGQGRGRPRLYCELKCEDRHRKKRERSKAKKKNRSMK